MGAGDEWSVAEAAQLFDAAPSSEWVALFLDDPGHHLFIAYEEIGGVDVPVGFIAGSEVYSIAKPPRMFINEAGVDPPFRGRGIGRALVDVLSDLAASRGCTSTWVLTAKDDVAALAVYQVDGAERDESFVLLEWEHEPVD